MSNAESHPAVESLFDAEPTFLELTSPDQARVISRREVLVNLGSVLVSGLIHLFLIWMFLTVYFEVAEKKVGSGFFVGRGEIVKNASVERVEGLDAPIEFNQAMEIQPAELNNRKMQELRQSDQPEVTLRPAANLPDLSGALKLPESKPSLESLVGRQWSAAVLTSRSGGMKQALLKSEGGTDESERAVARGLEWLAAHQNDDGSWSLSPGVKCGHDECGRIQNESLEAATGLAILPFLAAGHVPGQPGPYQKTLDKGLTWLQGRVSKQGRVMPDDAPTHFHMYAHAIVTIALCEARAMNPEGAWSEAAQRAANYVVLAQNREDGGWRYAPGQAGDTSVYGWQVMALRSARVAGMKIPKSTMTLTRRWLNNAATGRDASTYAYQPGRPASPVMTAEALLCRQLLGDGPRERGMSRGTQLVLDDAQRSMGSRNYYYWYYATQLLHNTGGKAWSRWNGIIREKLIAEQLKSKEDGHAVGSWQPLAPSMDPWGRAGGPIMQTSLGLLTLEVYYRHLPLYQVDLPKEATVTK